MKRLVLMLGLLAFSFTILSQSPDSFNYQMLVRNSDGDILSNENVNIQISILHGTATGMVVYTETFTTITSNNGIVSLKVGTGNSNDDFTSIDWLQGSYFIKTAVNNIDMGTTQLLSVPYAKFADKAGNVFSGNYNDLSNLPSFSGWDTNQHDDFSGNYDDLIDAPDFNLWDKNVYDDFSGNYDDLINVPSFIGWDQDASDDFSGNYEDLINKPNLIDTSNFISIASPTTGDVAYYDGENWHSLGVGFEGQILTVESGTPVWKDVSVSGTTRHVGELYLDGIIFYVSPDGQHGLIADLDDTSIGEIYSSGNTLVGASSFNDGSSNTDAILALYPTSNAASICRLKGSEWYLPSVWEMKLLFAAAYEINKVLENDGDATTNGLDTTTGTYWTSTEYSANRTYNYSVITGVIIDDNKSSTFRVRAIRAF